MATRAIRIASASGSVTDRRAGFKELAETEEVDFIVGDWMSEYNMTTRGAAKVNSKAQSAEFEYSFLEAIEPALPFLASRRIKVAVNAGASDPEKLHDYLKTKIASLGLDLKLAWIEGDEVTEIVKKAIETGDEMISLTTGKTVSEWNFDTIYAQCYLGAWGITEAFKQGADIVLCGRVTDASPIIGAAAYHFGWQRTDYSQLAHAFLAGHFIECSTYATGGNFSGFKSLPGMSLEIGFPIVEMEANGEFVVTKQKNKDGMVTVDTCKAQLLYEIQGPYYYNPDVVAVLDQVKIESVGENRIHVSNAEVHYFLVGLDIKEKAALLERQVRHMLDESQYHTLVFRTNGSCPSNPDNQDSATVDFRIFAQSRHEEALQTANFFRPCTDNIMQSYPGATFAVDARQGVPKPYYEYWVSVLPQTSVKHIAHLPFKGLSVPIDVPTDTEPFIYTQPSYETSNPVDLASFGPTIKGPLGWIVHARSGDKGSDDNVGFFVRHADEWDWLRSLLTVSKIRNLLGKDDVGKPIYRFELPNIWAVHFLLKDHLDRGVASSSTYDVLGKNVAEYLRCKHVDIPQKFLDRGKI